MAAFRIEILDQKPESRILSRNDLNEEIGHGFGPCLVSSRHETP